METIDMKKTKETRGQKKIKSILEKMRRLQDEERIKRAENLNKLPLAAKLAIKAAGVPEDEMHNHPLIGEKVRIALERKKDKGIRGLLGDERLCKLVAIDIAKGMDSKAVGKKHGVTQAAVEEFSKEYLKPVAEEMVSAKVAEERERDRERDRERERDRVKEPGMDGVGVSIKDFPVNSKERLEVMRPFMSPEELKIADEWERELQRNSKAFVDVRDFHVFRKAYMARVALERKQTIREGLDEAAAQSLEMGMRHRATDTVAAILQTMAQRKQRRDKWMNDAAQEGKFSALAPLDSNELKDIELLIRLSGLETSVLAEESVAGDHGSSKDTSVVMIRMDGLDGGGSGSGGGRGGGKGNSAGTQIVDIDSTPVQSSAGADTDTGADNTKQPITPAILPVHKLFALDITGKVDSASGGASPVRPVRPEDFGSVVERKREADDF